MKIGRHFAICFLALHLGFTSIVVFAKPLLIGYLGFWNVGNTITIDKIPGQLLTHVIYSFLTISDNGECKISPNDKLNLQGNSSALSQLHLLKQKNPALVLMAAIGGCGGSANFSNVAATDRSRKKFVSSCINTLQKYNLDGIDLDWEYPVTGCLPSDSKRPEDTKNFVLLLTEFRKELDEIPGTRKVLSAAVAGEKSKIANLDVRSMSKIADWLGVMAYDFYGTHSKTTGHHAGLFASQQTPQPFDEGNAQAAIDLYLTKGATPNKLVLGVPFYGHAWSHVENVNEGLFQIFKSVPKTKLGDGAVNYQEIQDQYLPHSIRYFDQAAQVPWLYDSKTKTMVSYEDPTSLKCKVNYVSKMKLKGIMIWELSHDNRTNDLLKALNSNFN